MKTPTEALLVVAVLFAQGCVERTDLSPVYEETATRSEIEAVLGEPVASRATEEGHISIYQYNTGEAVEVSEAYKSWATGLTYFTIVGGIPLMILAESIPQKGFLAVFYSADDDPTDIHLVRSGDPDTQMDRLVARLQVKRRAEEGDVEAMYEVGLMTDLEARWVLHCPAAHQGHANAQYSMADYYRYGWGGVEKNIIKSYVWLTLSLKGGDPRAAGARDRTERDMTADQIAEAESLLAKWKPNPAECEGEAKLAAD